MPNDETKNDVHSDDALIAQSAESDRAIERLFAALPELHSVAVEFWGDPVNDAGSFLIYGGVFGHYLNNLAGSEASERVADRDRAFTFLENLSRDGLEALDRGEDRLLHDLAMEVLEDISPVNLPRAYSLMGPLTRILLANKAAWNEYAHEQARRDPDRWLVENIEAFQRACQQATDTTAPDGSEAPDHHHH